jgi:hypothetical protein
MANCNIKIPFPPSGEDLLGMAKDAIINHKGIFNGDTIAGNFEIPVGIGTIIGHYTILDEVMDITITKKPLLVTCAMIESRLKGYLSPPAA